jgi:hypothetical protein
MVQVVAVHDMKACNWGRCIVPTMRYLHITLGGGLEINFTHRALNLGENTAGTRSTGGWVSPRAGVEYKKYLAPAGNRTR